MALVVTRDAARSVVYAVEDAWARVLDRGGPVDFFGSWIHLTAQRKFGDLDAMQAYADHWVARVGAGIRPVPDVRVRRRQGARQAHYEAGGVIAIPVEARWACRESVLLHELAHHADWAMRSNAHGGDAPVEAPAIEPHGAEYRGWMCWLSEQALGPEAALVLRAGYQGAGLAVADVT